ncbi:Small, acid-soluble spore protein I [compost metagenome]
MSTIECVRRSFRLQTVDLRQAIVMRVQNNSAQELSEVIEDSVGADERALPGLGVLFEMIWQQSSEPEQSRMVDSLYQHLHYNEHANPSQ